jgi:hypothetical protein
MSPYVATFSFNGTVITTHSRMRTFGTIPKPISPVVSIIDPMLSFPSRYGLTFPIFIDSPEIGPGAVLSPSSSASPTNSPTPLPPGGSSNTGAIVGGVIGGVAAISIAVVAIFLYRRRRHSRAAPGVGASQSPTDDIIKPLTVEGTNTGSSLPATSSLPGTPGASMRLYVRDCVPIPFARLCVLTACALLPFS